MAILNTLLVNGNTRLGNYLYVDGDIGAHGNITSHTDSNDYAEYRIGVSEDIIEPGTVICENGDDTLSPSTERLQPAGFVVSDTFGYTTGKTETATTPVALCGRVLAKTYQDRNLYKVGDCVCAAPGGAVDIMTREEIKEFPDRILGIVSSVPEYDYWGESEEIPINGRIWIIVK